MDFTENKSHAETFIAGYGDGGFRIGDQKFTGSLIMTPEGFYPWSVDEHHNITLESLEKVTSVADQIELLLIGMGQNMAFLNKEVRAALEKQGIFVDVMATGAAARTYNVLLQEGRRVAVALIAID